ncbi:MAG TPA: TerB family tellurite resistance protein [Gemmataceae bacterium]|nr:TerB family tellurite resistance protein [Gemmataceae bacterium]
MADFKQLAIDLILADGTIDEAEVKVLKKALYADRVIDKGEVEFLIDLRNQAQKKARGAASPAFEKFFFKAIEDNLLADGEIDSREAAWLRAMLFADGKIDDNEKKFLTRIKKLATKTSPAFEKLYEECMGK